MAELPDAALTGADAAPAVLHLDIDAFFASVEQARDPRLHGRPVAVGNGVIASCSYEARRYGLRAGTSLVEARRLCPDLVVLDGHQPTYRAFAERVWRLLGELTPDLDVALDEAFGDLAGTARLNGDLMTRCRQLQGAIAEATGGVSVTIGLGPNRMLAKLVGKTAKPAGLAAITAGEAEAFLAARPVKDLPGIGPTHAAQLATINVRTVADFRRLPVEALVALFGAVGPLLFARARGIDTRVVTAREIPTTLSRETAFHRATADPAELDGMLSYLAERACRATRALGLAPRTVGVKLRYADGGFVEGQRTPPLPTAHDPEVLALGRALLARLFTRRVRLSHLGVVLSRFVPLEGAQLDFLAPAGGVRAHRLVESVDHVRDRFGHASVISGSSIRLLGTLAQDRYGFVLRTPSLTK
jgi:DNA polymerase-4